MDIRIFFTPVSETLHKSIDSSHSFFKNIYMFGPQFPDIKTADIALIGVEESRGSESNTGAERGADEIRKKLYQLKKGTGPYKIIDLGIDATNPRISWYYVGEKVVKVLYKKIL